MGDVPVSRLGRMICGMLLEQSMSPFTKVGSVPDVIVNHAIPIE